MLALILISVGALVILTEWLWRRTSKFLIYQGESRIRRGRSLAHLSSEHYRPEGHEVLGWYRLAYLTTNVAGLLAFFLLIFRLWGRTA